MINARGTDQHLGDYMLVRRCAILSWTIAILTPRWTPLDSVRILSFGSGGGGGGVKWTFVAQAAVSHLGG